MSFIATAEHWLARVAHEVVVEVKLAEHWVATHQASLSKDIGVGTALLSVTPLAAIAPQLNAGLQAAWGAIAAACLKDDQTYQNGILQVAVDAQFIQSVKAVVAALQAARPDFQLPALLATADALAARATTPSAQPSTSLPK
jgi:hypothetical protein